MRPQTIHEFRTHYVTVHTTDIHVEVDAAGDADALDRAAEALKTAAAEIREAAE